MNASEQRELGALTAKVESMETRLASMEEKMTEVRDTIVGLRGGWKFALTLASVVGAVIGYGLQFVQLFQHK